jgi:hypothetical protein
MELRRIFSTRPSNFDLFDLFIYYVRRDGEMI